MQVGLPGDSVEHAIEVAQRYGEHVIAALAVSGSILLVAGPPGAGKSTVAALVADRFERSVHLHTDDFYAWIAAGTSSHGERSRTSRTC